MTYSRGLVGGFCPRESSNSQQKVVHVTLIMLNCRDMTQILPECQRASTRSCKVFDKLQVYFHLRSRTLLGKEGKKKMNDISQQSSELQLPVCLPLKKGSPKWITKGMNKNKNGFLGENLPNRRNWGSLPKRSIIWSMKLNSLSGVHFSGGMGIVLFLSVL